MSSSLQDQLLKAGLLSKQKARNANQDKKKSRRQGKGDEAARKRAAAIEADQARKRERDRQLNEQREQQRKAKEQSDWVRQTLGSHAAKRPPTDADTSVFNFTMGTKVHRLHVVEEQRVKLSAGKLGIVWFDGKYHLVDRSIAERLQERIPKRVWLAKDEPDAPDEDDPYADYKVPDDLIW